MLKYIINFLKNIVKIFIKNILLIKVVILILKIKLFNYLQNIE